MTATQKARKRVGGGQRGGVSTHKEIAEIRKTLHRLEPAPEVSLGEVFRAYPGGIAGLSKAIKRNTDTIYSFMKGRNRRRYFPDPVAQRITQAFRRKKSQPYGIDVDVNWLRVAWYKVPFVKGELERSRLRRGTKARKKPSPKR